jgi:hypothetical protein
VLDEVSPRLAKLGLSPDGVKPYGPKLDDEDLSDNGFLIGLRKNHGAELYTGYNLQLDPEQPRGEEYCLLAWVSIRRPGRDRLLHELQQQHSRKNGAVLGRDSDGTIWLFRCCDPTRLHLFDETFRILIEEWIELLRTVGGISPFLSAPPTKAESGSIDS